MRSVILYDICRIILGVVFLSSGIGKFYGSSGLIGPGWLFEELDKHNLLLFAIFIAVAELVIGYLLLIRRFATFGAVALFPMILNILIIVISLEWQGTPYIDGVFLLMNIYLLYYDYEKLLPILGLNKASDFLLFFSETKVYLLILGIILLGAVGSYMAWPNFRWVKNAGLVCLVIYATYRAYLSRKGMKLESK